jgi:hypothetical protein
MTRETAGARLEIVIASEAKQSRSNKARLDCFVAEFIIGPAKGRTRWLLAMTRDVASAHD